MPYNSFVVKTPLPSWLDVPSADLDQWFGARGHKPMRRRQVHRWLLVGRAETFEQMTDLPVALRQELAEAFVPFGTRIDTHQAAQDATHKLLLRLADDQTIECVLIQDAGRHTACISTQVGCGMGCVFCASGLNGVVRNLTTGEILEQLLRLRNLLPAGDRLTHVVVMGMGEPLANLDNLLAALEIAGARDGLDLGARHITISTVGLPAKIRRLADLGKQYHLAVSLHAPTEGLRTRIVPTNNKTGLGPILEAADYFFAKTGRQVTFEYVLLGGLNDSAEHARELVALLRGRPAHVNIIPFNEVEGLEFRRPRQDVMTKFTDLLRKGGVSVKVRKRKGSDIDAACGQLRRRTDGRVPLPTVPNLPVPQPETMAGVE
jgi:23S rRNA (adenine2503-C2)-methyltransferase